MGDGSEMCEVTCVVKRETERAYLIDIGTRELWVPKSASSYDGTTMMVKEWLATKEGLI